MCSWLLAHRRQIAKKKDHPNPLPVLEVALEQRTAMHRIWVASFADIYQPGIWGKHRTSSAVLCTLCHTLCSVTALIKQHSRNDKKKKKKKKKRLSDVSHHNADPGELIQWVTHESRSSAASNSGLIRIGAQPQTADAWHHDSCRPRGVVTRDFRPFLTVCLTVFLFEFRPRTFTIGFYGKKSFISELMILECSFPLMRSVYTNTLSNFFLSISKLKCKLQPNKRQSLSSFLRYPIRNRFRGACECKNTSV